MHQRIRGTGRMLSVCLALAVWGGTFAEDSYPGTRSDGSDLSYGIRQVQAELTLEWQLPRSVVEQLAGQAGDPSPGDPSNGDPSPGDPSKGAGEESIPLRLDIYRARVERLSAEPLSVTHASFRFPGQGPAQPPAWISAGHWVDEPTFAAALRAAELPVIRATVSLEAESGGWAFLVEDKQMSLAGRCEPSGPAQPADPQGGGRFEVTEANGDAAHRFDMRGRMSRPCEVTLEIKGEGRWAEALAQASGARSPGGTLSDGWEAEAWVYPRRVIEGRVQEVGLDRPLEALELPPLAITSVQVVDVEDGSIRSGRTLVIRGDRIAAEFPDGQTPIPEGARLLDGKGGFIVPGLIDAHTHMIPTDWKTEQKEWNPPAGYGPFVWWKQRYARALDRLVGHGVLGFRDLFADTDLAVRVKDALKRRELPAPRFVTATLVVDGLSPMDRGATEVASWGAAAELIEGFRAAGHPDGSFIKAFEGFDPRVFRKLLKSAVEAGVPVVGHAPLQVAAGDASDLGMRSMEHALGVVVGCSSVEAELLETTQAAFAGWKEGNSEPEYWSVFLDRWRRALEHADEEACVALLDRFAKNETRQVPTLVATRMNVARDGEDTLFSCYLARVQQIVGMMPGRGVSVVAGTDSHPLIEPLIEPGESLHQELALLVESGLTPLQALQSATREAADLLGDGNWRGRVEPGMAADLLLLEANPLEDIAHLRDLRAVVLRGEVVHRAVLLELRGR